MNEKAFHTGGAFLVLGTLPVTSDYTAICGSRSIEKINTMPASGTQTIGVLLATARPGTFFKKRLKTVFRIFLENRSSS